MGIMAEPRQLRPSLPDVRYAPSKTARKQDIIHMTVRLTAAMITATDIVMIPAVSVKPPQHPHVHIIAEDMAVIKLFAGSI